MPRHLHREMANQFLHQIGDLLEIRIGPVGFEHGELGIVPARNAFVPEVSVQLENLVEAAHEQPLQIKLRRDAERKIEAERIVMGAERLGRRAARHRLQHRRFHFQKSAVFQKPAHLAHDQDPLLEDGARMLVREQIEIALPIARLHILQPVPFFRQRPQRFRKHLRAR